MACVVHTTNGVPVSVVGDDGTNWEFTVQEDAPSTEETAETPADETAEATTETSVEETTPEAATAEETPSEGV